MNGGRSNLILRTHELFLTQPPLGLYRVRVPYNDGMIDVTSITY